MSNIWFLFLNCLFDFVVHKCHSWLCVVSNLSHDFRYRLCAVGGVPYGVFLSLQLSQNFCKHSGLTTLNVTWNSRTRYTHFWLVTLRPIQDFFRGLVHSQILGNADSSLPRSPWAGLVWVNIYISLSLLFFLSRKHSQFASEFYPRPYSLESFAAAACLVFSICFHFFLADWWKADNLVQRWLRLVCCALLGCFLYATAVRIAGSILSLGFLYLQTKPGKAQ